MGEDLLSLSGVEAQREAILERAQQLLACRAELWLKDTETEDVGLWTTSSSSKPSPLMEQAWRQKCLVRDQGDRCLAAPVEAQGEAFGVLQLCRPEGPEFNHEEIDFVNGLALQSAIVISNSRQRALDRRKVELLTLVRQVSVQIAKVLEINELARRITQAILSTFQYYYVAIFTIEPGQDVLLFRDSAGPIRHEGLSNDEEDFSPALSVRIGQGMIGWAAQTGQEILANDVSLNPLYRCTEALPETRAEFVLPLRVGNRVLGVLDVQSDKVNAFSEMDTLVLRSLANNIAPAIENARLYSSLNRQAKLLALVAEISNAITSILDLDNLLNNVVSLVHQRFGYPRVYIFTVHHGLGKIVYRVGSGADLPDRESILYDLNDSKGLIPWAAREGETVLVNDVTQDERYAPTALSPEGAHSEMVVPLIFGGHVLGILDVISEAPNAFGDEDRFVFEALADNIAIAIRNANLYRSEQWRRQVADSMREVAGLLSADIALDEVLDRILQELERNLPCDISAIWLLEEAASSESRGFPASSLRLAAIREKLSQDPGSEIGLARDRPFLQMRLDELRGYDLLLRESPWIQDALLADRPLIRLPDMPYEPLGALVGFSSDYSAIAAPLRIGEQVLGLLTLVHHTPGRYGSESQMMTTAFASYASVAIENAKLYQAAHDQAWISTALLQVAEATQSITSRHELLDTVVHIIHELVGVNACAILMWDKTAEEFVPTAFYGLTPEQQENFRRWSFGKGVFPAFDTLLGEKKSVLIDREMAPTDGTSTLFSAFDPDQDVLALFPMIVQGEVTGAIFVDFSDSVQHDTALDQWGEKLLIIQGIAHQTAIAAENIRLLEAQEEEAYVSVALLQVAQTVVSSNDLDEVLASIVRITPILVGVKRCAVFLWNANKQVFEPSAAYGVPKDEMEVLHQACGSNRFPLLAAVRQHNCLVYHPITDAMKKAVDWAKLEPSEHALGDLQREAAEISREFLKRQERLLYGLPLSVKGNLLGVMIIEEESMFDRSPSAYIRAKRLEIMTGITQQAALAVQNDLLQREVVERERLEREIQLAREIQQTFLPDHLPQLPGWDLAIRWMPARQVGGDFYDVIELKEGRLGLVIADVADKGMPAALFMTLIRTLIRAAALSEDSPGRVLEKVNNLLVPDAKHGMFVTVFYAVLYPEKGLLSYANAGHNPALLYRHHSRTLDELKRTSMALGVVENIQIGEQTIALENGDQVVFYTDGVTEAISTQEEFYGIERLRNLVLGFTGPAEDLAKQIVASVQDFAEGLAAADDLTVAVLKRHS